MAVGRDWLVPLLHAGASGYKGKSEKEKGEEEEEHTDPEISVFHRSSRYSGNELVWFATMLVVSFRALCAYQRNVLGVGVVQFSLCCAFK